MGYSCYCNLSELFFISTFPHCRSEREHVFNYVSELDLRISWTATWQIISENRYEACSGTLHRERSFSFVDARMRVSMYIRMRKTGNCN